MSQVRRRVVRGGQKVLAATRGQVPGEAEWELLAARDESTGARCGALK